MSILEDHRLELTDFTIVHDNKSIGAGPDVALFLKYKDSEPSDKVLCSRVAISDKMASHMAAAQQVFICSLSVRVTRWS